jgi:arylsulfatase A-like enzyme/Tfp pilus assembly protein PilF
MAKKKRRQSKKRRTSQTSGPKRASQAGLPKESQSRRPSKKKPLVAVLSILFVLAAAVVVFRLLISPNPVKKDSSLNVLLVTLDTTRADRLGCYGYKKARTPNLDRLAAEGVRFSDVYCQVPLTTPSHCSILTGTYPIYHQVHNNGSYVLRPELVTLAEVLKEHGFGTAAFVGSFTVDSRFGLAQGFDVYDDKFAEGQAFKALNSERKADKVFAAFSGWLNKNQAQPFFCWVHFYDPHLPYDPPAPYNEEFAASPYDGEIAYVDFYLGKTIEALREKNLLAKTLIVVAGDHGEAFGEKIEAGHGIFLYDGTMKVPLILYAQDHLPAGRIVGSRVRLIDIMPTILDMLSIPAGRQVQGTSLLPFAGKGKKTDLSSYLETYFPRENYGWSELVGLVDGDWKYIKAPREELYNLKSDPGETKNVLGREPKVAADMRAELVDLIARDSSEIESEKRALSAAENEKLRSLGYVGYSTETSSGPLPDPKDMTGELEMNQEAEQLELAGNYSEAAKIYEAILKLRPGAPTSYINLALVQAKMSQFEAAVGVLEQGVSRIPGSEMLMARLAHTYMVMGRLKKALDAWQALLVIDPRYFDALLASGWILDFMGKGEEARAYFERALEVEPENRFLRKYYAMNLGKGGDLKAAISVYERLAQDYPDDYEVFQDLGTAYGYAGDLSRAIDSLKKAISLHPTPSAYFNLAVALRKVGSIEEAVKTLRLYLENPEGESEESIRMARQELSNLERLLKQ